MASNCNNGTSIANNGETSGASLETVGAANQILGQPPLVHMLLGILQRQEHTQGRQTDILEQLVQSEEIMPRVEDRVDYYESFCKLNHQPFQEAQTHYMQRIG